MRKLLLLFIALLGIGTGGAWATDVLIANCPNFKANTASSVKPTTYGSFSGQTFTTNATSGMAGITITADAGCEIGEAYVNVNNYGDCLSLKTANSSTSYKITLTAPEGYVITGYTLGGSANTDNNKHTLTSKDGTVSVVVSSPAYNSNPAAPKEFAVSGLKEQTTYFNIQTANGGNTLYIPTFTIYVYPESQVRDVTYHVYYDGTQKATATATNGIVSVSTLSLPSSATSPFCTYKYYSDSNMGTEITTVPETGDVYADATWNGPFTISSTFNSATWYYLKIRTSKYVVYGDAAPYTLTTTKEDGKKGQWAFIGNPYDGFQVINRSAGNGQYLQATATQPSMTTTATNWVIGYNGGNFTLYDSSVGYMNDAGSNNLLKYWNSTYGATDDGSTFRVEAAPSDAEALSNLRANYEVAAANLDKPGFPTTAAYNTFRSTIEGFTSLEAWDEGIDAALTAVKASVIYPNGTYYIKNRNTGCYAFITDDGELLPRIKIDNTVSHANNNYLWTVTSDKETGTCTIKNSLYSSVPFAKGDNNYSSITSSNRTVITTLSTELFSSNNGSSGAFYLNGAHNNNVYTGNGEGTGNSHVVSWDHQDSPGSQWVFEPVDLGTAYTVTVEGLDNGGEDAVTLSDGTIVNLGTGTVYLSETPTTSNITQNEVSGYSIQDGSIVVDTENHTITVTYSPSYDVLVANYYDSAKEANVKRAGTIGYPKTTTDSYTMLLSLISTFTDGHEYTAADYANIQSYYEAYVAETDIVTPSAGFYKIYYPRSNGDKKYVTVSESAPNAKVTVTDEASAIWYYSADRLLIAYSNGYQVKGNASGNEEMVASNDGLAVTFSKSNVANTFGFMNVTPTQKSPWYVSPETTDYVLNRWQGGSHDGQQFQVEPVTSLPVTFRGEYASFYSPVDLTIPEGVEVYTGTLNGAWLTLNAVEGTLPANTGVILRRTSEETTTVNFPVLTTANAVESSLTGTVAAKTVDASSVLVLGKDGDDWGLYTFSGTTLGGFKAYMDKSGGDVKGIRFNFGDTLTGIEAAEVAGSLNGAIYNLAGQRVQQPARGLYIIGGKKVAVK